MKQNVRSRIAAFSRRIRKQMRRCSHRQMIGLLLTAGFLTVLAILAADRSPVNLAAWQNYQEKYASVSIGVCADSSDKTYMDYRKITDQESVQYQYIRKYMKVDSKTGFLYDKDGFIGVALGYQFGDIGTRYYFRLDSGITLPVVKIEAKDPKDAADGCKVNLNGSVLEFVIDENRAADYFGTASNGLVLQGNFNNDARLAGSISDIRLVQN